MCRTYCSTYTCECDARCRARKLFSHSHSLQSKEEKKNGKKKKREKDSTDAQARPIIICACITDTLSTFRAAGKFYTVCSDDSTSIHSRWDHFLKIRTRQSPWYNFPRKVFPAEIKYLISGSKRVNSMVSASDSLLLFFPKPRSITRRARCNFDLEFSS